MVGLFTSILNGATHDGLFHFNELDQGISPWAYHKAFLLGDF